jgi:hypothetical protein
MHVLEHATDCQGSFDHEEFAIEQNAIPKVSARLNFKAAAEKGCYPFK